MRSALIDGSIILAMPGAYVRPTTPNDGFGATCAPYYCVAPDAAMSPLRALGPAASGQAPRRASATPAVTWCHTPGPSDGQRASRHCCKYAARAPPARHCALTRLADGRARLARSCRNFIRIGRSVVCAPTSRASTAAIRARRFGTVPATESRVRTDTSRDRRRGCLATGLTNYSTVRRRRSLRRVERDDPS